MYPKSGLHSIIAELSLRGVCSSLQDTEICTYVLVPSMMATKATSGEPTTSFSGASGMVRVALKNSASSKMCQSECPQQVSPLLSQLGLIH